MKVNEITVSFGVTANLGNYNSVKIEMSATAQIIGEIPVVARTELLDQLQAEVYAAIALVKGKKPNNKQEDLL